MRQSLGHQAAPLVSKGQKGTPFAAQIAAEKASKEAVGQGMKKLKYLLMALEQEEKQLYVLYRLQD